MDAGLLEDSGGVSVVDGGLVEGEATEVVTAIEEVVTATEPVVTVGSANSEPPPQATRRATRTLRLGPLIHRLITSR